jgi:DNA helicase-2/ATP-dependent DNA helicase PcrA
MPSLADSLNPEQLQAVKQIEGPLLILAGAGSGKTRVITYRIAYMLGQGIPQHAILAVTFTNRAAQEMAQRVRELCAQKLANLKVCTFHAFGAAVLRWYGRRLGYRRHFSIYDETDKQALIKEAARELGLISRDTTDGFDAYRIAALFSRIKSDSASWDRDTEHLRPLFDEYSSRLKLFNAVDFDDLIRLPIELLERHEDVRTALQDRYRYFMVDEFQDTSHQQYRLLRLLARGSGNLCVVGDDDQSIYSWRGAHFENILEFERDFPGFREVKLEQNYRSTGRILQAANRLIGNNRNRKGKNLWSALGEGEALAVIFPENEQREAEHIAATIRSLSLKQRIPLSQFGVLVRTNALTRAIEEAFLRENLLYQVSGGMSFFQRKEVKDIVAYLKIAANPDDDLNLLRIINTPRRGIGRKTLEAVVDTACKRECSLYSALSALQDSTASGGALPSLPDKAAGAIAEFISLIETYRSGFLKPGRLAPTLSALIEEIDYWGYLLQENPRPAVCRWKYSHVEGLVDSLAAYEEDPDNPGPNLYEYLNRISLATRDNLEDPRSRERVNLMTIHAAKGLEFDTVFIAGLEDGLLPHARSLAEGQHNLEEERRLFYVALTRAKRRLSLSSCKTRRRRGQPIEAEPSPFLDELPRELLEYPREEEDLSLEEAKALFAAMKRGFR